MFEPVSAQDLPKWTDEDRARMKKGDFIAGAILLVDDPTINEIPEPAAGAKVEIPEPEEAEPEYDPEVIPEEFLAAYFATNSETFLIDPQKLLSKQEAADREGFLDYHAVDSLVDIKLYLFDAEQQIPSQYSLAALAEAQYGKGDLTAVVFCFLGNPSRNKLAFAGKGSEAMETVEVRRMLENAIIKAVEKSDPAGQIEAFIVQLSIKLYWIERALAKAQEQQHPAENPYANNAEKAESKGAESPGVAAKVKPYLLYILVAGGGVLLTLLGCSGSFVLWRKNKKYHFPVLELPRRLGADYAAGVGAVIAFHNKQGSPSSQRDQVPDYLTRM